MIGKALLILIGLLSLLTVCLTIFFLATEYRPDPVVQVAPQGHAVVSPLKMGSEISLVSFDIGFAGLDEAQEEYANGGRQTRPAAEQTIRDNLEALTEIMSEGEYDLMCLQSVDTGSKRSYYVKESDVLAASLPEYVSCFAPDYKVSYDPFPLFGALGKVESGLMTLSKYPVFDCNRIQLPQITSIPGRFFDRSHALLVTRLPLEGGGQLTLVNVNMSCREETPDRQKELLAQLSAFLADEAKEERYCIVAANWGAMLPGTGPGPVGSLMPLWCRPLPEDFAPAGYSWAVDTEASTWRNGDQAYRPGETFEAIMDGFLVSDNIDVRLVRTFPLAFARSDHNPVALTFALKRPGEDEASNDESSNDTKPDGDSDAASG